MIFSNELITEFIEVAERPKFRKYFEPDLLEELLSRINAVSEYVKVKSTISACRDPKDDFLLALAKDGKATHLLTGDKDLLALYSFGKTRIMTITDYLNSI